MIAVKADAGAFPVAHAQGERLADRREVAPVGADRELMTVLLAVDGDAQIDVTLFTGVQ